MFGWFDKKKPKHSVGKIDDHDKKPTKSDKYETIHTFMRHALGPNGHVSEAEIFEALARNLEDELLYARISKELPEAFSDAGYSWKNSFKEYHQYSFPSESDAREYAAEYLWKPVFGNRQPPGLNDKIVESASSNVSDRVG